MGVRFCIAALLLSAVPAHAQRDPLAPTAALVRAGEDERALRTMRRLSGARAAYLRARLLDRLGRTAEAARAYPTGAVASALPEAVRRDSAERRAIALARTGGCAGAIEVFEPLRNDPMIEARIAECTLAAGDVPHAVERLRAVVRRSPSQVDLFSVRMSLAEALARSGENDEAADVLLPLVVERPEHPEAASARTALEALRGTVELTFDQRMRRAEAFYEARLYTEALAELDAAGRPRRRPELRRWIHLRGMALYDARQAYEEAAAALAESGRLEGPSSNDDQFLAARALSRANRDDDAVIAYRRFASDHPEHERAPEASYLAAWLELRHEVRGGERSMTAFARSPLAARAPSFAREATWQLALRAFVRARYTRAARLFAEYVRSDEDTLVRARGIYWEGRARQQAGDRTRALAAYREALYVEPLHWYALLARQRIVELGESAGPPFPEPPGEGTPRPSVGAVIPELVRFYDELGLVRDARAALEHEESAIRRAHDLDVVIAAYAEIGDPARTRRLAANQHLIRQREQPGPNDRWLWDAAYPRPWADRVRAAMPRGLRPAHLYAIMWQESGFDPDAVSYADAIGLMQLLPSTAERVGERAGVEVTREMLFDPAMNIRLGASYLGTLEERLGVPLCFAGYNGGGHNVERWLEQRGETDLDLFVEQIPFEQTRNYVRRVTSHLAHYLYLESPSREWPALELPARVGPRAAP